MKTTTENKRRFIEKYVDLHMHTTASDGSYYPSVVIRTAYKRGIRVISVTDHDTVASIIEAGETAMKLGMEFHTGIEMTTDIVIPEYYADGKLINKPLKTELHILGYDIDTEDGGIKSFCSETANMREAYNKKIMDFLYERFHVGADDIGRQYIKGYLGKPQIAAAFQKTGTIKTIDEIMARVFTEEDFLSIEKERLMSERAVKTINNSGGKAVLAHPGRIKKIGERESDDFFRNIQIILKQLKTYGLSGLECVYLRHTDPENRRFLKPTRGTDFHS